jgi:hypothetical protein
MKVGPLLDRAGILVAKAQILFARPTRCYPNVKSKLGDF